MAKESPNAGHGVRVGIRPAGVLKMASECGESSNEIHARNGETNRRPAELHQYKGDDEVAGNSLDELDDLLLVRHRVLGCLNFVFV